MVVLIGGVVIEDVLFGNCVVDFDVGDETIGEEVLEPFMISTGFPEALVEVAK